MTVKEFLFDSPIYQVVPKDNCEDVINFIKDITPLKNAIQLLCYFVVFIILSKVALSGEFLILLICLANMKLLKPTSLY